jgi:threonine/homoserine/homoserine lactone efflux protein
LLIAPIVRQGRFDASAIQGGICPHWFLHCIASVNHPRVLVQASTDLWLFFAMVFGVIVLPGMDMAFVAGSALTQGLRGGLTAVAGIAFAGMLHVLVGATGITALLLLWPAVYNALLVAGAVYMLWPGASMLRSGSAAPSASTAAPAASGGDLRTRGADLPAQS